MASVTHLGRGPSAAQRIALLWRDPKCVVEGCNAVRTEVDHRIPWAQTHHTRLDELDNVCDHHHDLKTYEGWALVAGSGRRPMVPPDDPRHPGQAAFAHAPLADVTGTAGRVPPAGDSATASPSLFGPEAA